MGCDTCGHSRRWHMLTAFGQCKKGKCNCQEFVLGGRGVVARSGKGDSWATPKWLLQILFPDGHFFDPCPVNGSGGLETDWPTDVPVYINPPFSDPLPWVRKASHHAGHVVLLLPLDPTTRWWTYSGGFEIIIIGSRLHFSESKTYARGAYCFWRK